MSSRVSSTANAVCVCGESRHAGPFRRLLARMSAITRVGRVARTARPPASTAAALPTHAMLAPEEVLAVLPATASPALRGAIAAGCCVTYTVAEGHCAPDCGSGSCCFHVVSVDCNINTYECLNRPCDKGDFSTGC